jgi:hypothetical protein
MTAATVGVGTEWLAPLPAVLPVQRADPPVDELVDGADTRA